MDKGTIKVARVDKTEYIQFEGIVRYSHCSGLELHIDRVFQQFDFDNFVIDLTKADILDSTALGLMAKIAIEQRKFTEKRPIILVNPGELSQILKRVCFDQVFHLVTNESLFGQGERGQKYSELSDLPGNEEQVLETVIKAHQSLASLSEQNEQLFKDITGGLT